MAGDDDTRARETLAEMQLRISQGPTSALGIGEIVTPEEVRAAFLQLTKQFHPARFGRLAPDVQKLANEVFLGIKSAHDYMLKVLGSSPRASARSSQPAMANVPAEGSRGTAVPSGGRGTMPPPGRASSPVIGTPSRPTTPPMGVPITRPTTPPFAGQAPGRPATLRPGQTAPTAGSTGAIPRTPVPPGTQPGVGVGVAMGPSASQRIPRVEDRASSPPLAAPPGQGTQPPSGRGPVLPTRPAPDSFNPPTVRNVPTPPPVAGPGSPMSDAQEEQQAFRAAAALMERKDWSGARQALHALAARVPQSRLYRAWLCYARGREAYVAGRPDDAIVEMQRALQLEPDLAHAKHALAELQRRR